METFRRIEDPIDPRSIRIAEAEGNQNARSSSTEPRVFAFSLLRKKICSLRIPNGIERAIYFNFLRGWKLFSIATRKRTDRSKSAKTFDERVTI